MDNGIPDLYIEYWSAFCCSFIQLIWLEALPNNKTELIIDASNPIEPKTVQPGPFFLYYFKSNNTS